MRRVVHSFCLCIMALLPAGAWAADKPSSLAGETAAEKQRKALDQVRDLEIADLPLDLAVNQLREQTGINFVIDQSAVMAGPGVEIGKGVSAGAGIEYRVPVYAHLRMHIHSIGLPVRTALRKMLLDHRLTHVLVGDTVYITTTERAIDRQLGQSVSVNVEATPLGDVLKRLARETGANLVLDPASAKAGQTALTVRLDEVPLETAVEVLADEAGLRVVRLSNVLYVTSEARAAKLRKPTLAAVAPVGGWQVWPDGKGGFRMTPPAGAGIGGGIGGLGGMLGALGMGGGIAGMGGAVKPVPLTPPLPKAKQPAPDKPKPEAPPAKPAITKPAKDKPAPKGKSAAEAIRPDARMPRSRRTRTVII